MPRRIDGLGWVGSGWVKLFDNCRGSSWVGFNDIVMGRVHRLQEMRATSCQTLDCIPRTLLLLKIAKLLHLKYFSFLLLMSTVPKTLKVCNNFRWKLSKTVYHVLCRATIKYRRFNFLGCYKWVGLVGLGWNCRLFI